MMVAAVTSRGAHRPATTNWSVGVLQGPSLDRLAPIAGVANPIVSEHDLADCGGTMAADPFAIRVDGAWFLFFEMVPKGSSEAVIAAATSLDLRTWRQLGPVLDVGHHLSYPFVFEHDGEIFMMPESKRARCVTIYRATSFPHGWRPVRTILRGKYSDASMVRYEGRYWLFVCWHAYSMRVFHADHPLGPWRSHAWPCIRAYSPAAARPGGRPVVLHDRLIRFGQDNVVRYGHRLRAWHVTTLSPLWYEERPWLPTPILEPSGTGWNARCMHHLDPHCLPDGTIVAFVDGLA